MVKESAIITHSKRMALGEDNKMAPLNTWVLERKPTPENQDYNPLTPEEIRAIKVRDQEGIQHRLDIISCLPPKMGDPKREAYDKIYNKTLSALRDYRDSLPYCSESEVWLDFRIMVAMSMREQQISERAIDERAEREGRVRT